MKFKKTTLLMVTAILVVAMGAVMVLAGGYYNTGNVQTNVSDALYISQDNDSLVFWANFTNNTADGTKVHDTTNCTLWINSSLTNHRPYWLNDTKKLNASVGASGNNSNIKVRSNASFTNGTIYSWTVNCSNSTTGTKAGMINVSMTPQKFIYDAKPPSLWLNDSTLVNLTAKGGYWIEGLHNRFDINVTVWDQYSIIDNESVRYRITNVTDTSGWRKLRNQSSTALAFGLGQIAQFNLSSSVGLNYSPVNQPEGNFTLTIMANDTMTDIAYGNNNTNDSLINYTFFIDNDTPFYTEQYRDFGNSSANYRRADVTNLSIETATGSYLWFNITLNDSKTGAFRKLQSINYTWVSLNTTGVNHDTKYNFTGLKSKINGTRTTVSDVGLGHNVSIGVPLDYNQNHYNHTNPGVHRIKLCARDMIGKTNCTMWYNLTIAWVNASDVEGAATDTSSDGLTVTMNITNTTSRTQFGDVPISMNISYANYTFIFNVTGINTVNNTKSKYTFVEGITNLTLTNMNHLHNLTDINETPNAALITNIGTVVTGLTNITWQFIDTTAIINDTDYIFGKTILNKTFDEAFYCNTTAAAPTCYRLEWCNTSAGVVVEGVDINDTNYNTIIPAYQDRACRTWQLIEGTNRTVIMSRTLSGGAAADDNTAPSITHTCDTTSTYKGGAITCSCTANDNVDGDILSTNISYTASPSTSSVGTFSTTCTVNDKTGNSGTDTISYTVRAGGGAAQQRQAEGAAEATTKATVTQTIAAVAAGVPSAVAIDSAGVAITGVSITTTADVSDVKITVESLSEKPATAPVPTGSIYQYFDIGATNIEGKLDSGEITFTIPKSWITSKNIDKDKVALNRYADNKWNALTTTLAEEGTTSITYKATTPGFSYFVITGQEKGAEAVEGEAEGEEVTPIAPSIPTWIYYLIIIVIIGVVAYYFYSKKKK